MKRWGIISIVMLLAMALGTATASASYIYLDTTDNLTISIVPFTGNPAVPLTSTLSTVVLTGTTPNDSATVTGPTSASYTGGPYAANLAANITSVPLHHATASLNDVAPVLYHDAFVTNSGVDKYVYTFTPTVSGNYTINISDLYTYAYGVNNTGVWQYDYAKFTAGFEYSLVGGVVNTGDHFNYVNNATYNPVSGFYLDSFSVSGGSSDALAPLVRRLNAGTTYTLSVDSNAYLEAHSIPIPGSVLLLGSGLLGLGLLRFRSREKKS
jgi:hypothetical protein